MKLIACLGNPGRQYARTRHNIGFIIGEALAAAYGVRPEQKKFQAVMGTGASLKGDFILVFPQTYMNNSGQAVQSVLDYYRMTVVDLIVIHDEIELPFGEVKTKRGGGHKGHNGLRSIVEHLDSPDFSRLRFGVGRPDDERISVADYVLARFTQEEFDEINRMMPAVIECVMDMLENGG